MRALSKVELQYVEAFVEAHHDLQIEQREDLQNLSLTNEDFLYRIVKTACWQLGFVNQDAELIAKAFLSETAHHTLNPQFWPSKASSFGITPRDEFSFPECPQNMGLYVIAPDSRWIRKLAEAGVKTLQLRIKDMEIEQVQFEIKESIRITKDLDCHLFINDYWQLAIDEAAYGVHLGQEDLELADLEFIKSAGLRLGLSSHGYQEMVNASKWKPSYMALGAIFPTTLKKMQTAPQGIGRLKKYAQILKGYPLVGIGGINETNIQSVLHCGVGSAAVVRSVIGSEDYEASIRILKMFFH